MESNSTTKPPFSSSSIYTSTGDHNISLHSINRTLLNKVISSTNNVITASSTVTPSKGNSSVSGDVDMLFTWVFVACIGLALLLVISLFMVIVCWKARSRSRSANVTDVKKGAQDKDRKRRRGNLRQSLKKVFVADGPLYAVSQLNVNRYSGLPEPENRNNSNSESNRSSMEIIMSPTDSQISKDNQKIIYQRYLSPIEGVPSDSPTSALAAGPDREDQTYLQPIDELRASKRFLQNSKDEPEEAYLEPLHGIPVPDEVQQETSTSKVKPIPSPKPKVKPK